MMPKAGSKLGKTFGDGVHYREPEGIVLLTCGPEEGREGFLIDADQTQPSRFLVYGRRDLDFLGGFTGEPTIDITDGIAFGPEEIVGVEGGLFYATHHDVQVVGYRWPEVAAALDFPDDCR